MATGKEYLKIPENPGGDEVKKKRRKSGAFKGSNRAKDKVIAGNVTRKYRSGNGTALARLTSLIHSPSHHRRGS